MSGPPDEVRPLLEARNLRVALSLVDRENPYTTARLREPAQ